MEDKPMKNKITDLKIGQLVKFNMRENSVFKKETMVGYIVKIFGSDVEHLKGVVTISIMNKPYTVFFGKSRVNMDYVENFEILENVK
jgi:hypothetical protein